MQIYRKNDKKILFLPSVDGRKLINFCVRLKYHIGMLFTNLKILQSIYYQF